LLPTPLASIDGVDEASTEAAGVGDAEADLDGFGRARVGVGVGDAEGVREGRGAITSTVPLKPWMVQW